MNLQRQYFFVKYSVTSHNLNFCDEKLDISNSENGNITIYFNFLYTVALVIKRKQQAHVQTNKVHQQWMFNKLQEMIISLIDDGQPYDPTLIADPDTTLSVEERPVGGLGIFLIKKITDKVEYVRKTNKNYLMLTKNMNQ